MWNSIEFELANSGLSNEEYDLFAVLSASMSVHSMPHVGTLYLLVSYKVT